MLKNKGPLKKDTEVLNPAKREISFTSRDQWHAFCRVYWKKKNLLSDAAKGCRSLPLPLPGNFFAGVGISR